LSLQDREDLLDVQAIEGPVGSQGGCFVADVEGPIDQPDVGFDGCAADGEGGVEGDIPPVVVVGVDRFLVAMSVRRPSERSVLGHDWSRPVRFTGTIPLVRSVG
jgi:hypothetical protein